MCQLAAAAASDAAAAAAAGGAVRSMMLPMHSECAHRFANTLQLVP
jgi:hypothetical protein